MAELVKTSIKDVEVANDAIITQLAKIHKTTKGEIEEMINFVGTYIYEVITTGNMETVMIPYFGKFKPKVKRLQAMKKAQTNRANGSDIIYRAMKGKAVLTKAERDLIKQLEDETVRDSRGLPGKTE